jgi:hypothetical protein
MSAEEHFSWLLEKYLEGTLTAEERQSLRAMLAAQEGCRAEFVETVLQEAALRALHREGALGTVKTSSSPAPNRLTWSRRGQKSWVRLAVGLAAVLLVAVGITWWGLHRKEAPAEIGRLEQVRGDVFVLGQTSRSPARSGQPLLSGQGLQVSSDDGLAVLVLPDSTRLELGAGTAFAEFAHDDRDAPAKKVTLGEDAYLVADVARQPAGRPMLLATRHAVVAVQDGKLSIANAATATHIDVEKGAPMQLTCRSDGRSLEIGTGFSGDVSADGEKAPRTWVRGFIQSVDAERGLLSVTIKKEIKEFQVTEATQLSLAPKGRSIKERLRSKLFVPGVQVGLTTQTKDGQEVLLGVRVYPAK